MTVAIPQVRLQIESEIRRVAQPGDIVLRFGDAIHIAGDLEANLSVKPVLRFSKMICELENPRAYFSHSATLNNHNGFMMVFDMSDEGLRNYYFRDWMQETHCGGSIRVIRPIER